MRELLAAGDVAGAAEVLGRPYELRGPMRAGVLCVDERMCMPADGRYSGTVTEGGDADHPGGSGAASRPAVVAIGADDEVTTANGAGPELVSVRIGNGPGPPGIVRLHARIDGGAAGVGR